MCFSLSRVIHVILSTLFYIVICSSAAFGQASVVPGETSDLQVRSEMIGTADFFLATNSTAEQDPFSVSYCCTIRYNVGTSYTAAFSNSSLFSDKGSLRPATFPNHRFCGIIPPSNTTGYSFSVAGVSSTNPDGGKFELLCAETSLYGGFNTSVNDFNFLEITNTSNGDISLQVFAIDFAGNTIIDGESLTLSANQRVDLDIHTRAGAANFGTIRIVHDGPFGSVKATTSYYKGSPTDFTLTGTVPATPRDRVR